MSTIKDQERVRARLRANAQDLARAERELEKVRDKRRALIRQARDAGLTVIEIGEITGLTRTAVYDVLHE